MLVSTVQRSELASRYIYSLPSWTPLPPVRRYQGILNIFIWALLILSRSCLYGGNACSERHNFIVFWINGKVKLLDRIRQIIQTLPFHLNLMQLKLPQWIKPNFYLGSFKKSKHLSHHALLIHSFSGPNRSCRVLIPRRTGFIFPQIHHRNSFTHFISKRVISRYSLRTSCLFIMWGETDTEKEMKKGK